MPVLILLALGLGVALTVYELSPRAHARVDDYARAIGAAYAAHRTADQHLANASMATTVAEHHQVRAQDAQPAPAPTQPFPPPVVMPPPVMQPPVVQPQPQVVQTPPLPVQPQPAPVQPQTAPVQPPPQPAPVQPQTAPVQPPIVIQPPPQVLTSAPVDVANAHETAAQSATDVAVENVSKADDANKEAAKNTAEAAKSAKTQAERQQAAQSARKVIENERQIADALKRLGIGACGVRTYSPITARARDTLLAKLHADGMSVTGNNPWDIDPNKFGVKLRALWIPSTRQLKLIVTDKSIAGCSDIWKQLDPKIKEVM